jgi:hypothetical protein
LVKLEGINLTAGGQFNICTIVTSGSGYNTGSALKATTGGSGSGMTVGIGYGLSNQLTNVAVVDPGTGYVDGDVITVSEGTSGTFVLTRYNDQANQGNNNFVEFSWTFGNDGSTTLPGAVVKSTVAKTGIAYNTGTATSLSDSGYINPIVDGNYGPFTRGLVTFTVVVTGGAAAYTVTNTTGNTAVGDVIGTLDTGDLGGTSGSTANIAVADVIQAVTALDLTKSVNKLTDGSYTLANGVEGQIMYIVRQNGSTAANIFVEVASARWDGSVYSDQPVIPFQIPFTDMVTIIFTDGAWQSSTFGSLT